MIQKNKTQITFANISQTQSLTCPLQNHAHVYVFIIDIENGPPHERS